MKSSIEQKEISKLSNKTKMFIGICFFRLTLDVIYFKYVSTMFNYDGFLSVLKYDRYLLSWFILLIFIPVIIKMHNKVIFSSVILILVGYLSVVPFTTMVAFYPFPIDFILQNTLYWCILYIAYKAIPGLTIKRIKNDKLVNLIIASIIVVFSVTIIYIWGRYTGFRITLNIFNVYERRRETSNFNLPTIIVYIYSATKALNPLLIVYFLHKKKYKLVPVIFAIQIISFSINGSKMVLLSTFLAVILYWVYSVRYLYKIPWILGIMGVLSGLEVVVIKSNILINFIIRRVFFVPNLLSYYYFDFFSVHKPDYFKQSFLSYFGFQSEYKNIVYLIGELYFGRPNMAANNGFISDAYSNLGWLGIIIMPIIIVVALKFLDACAKGLDIKIFILSAITMSFIFISASFFTTLLTHGFIAVCIVLYLLPRD